ncbi:hypothetical protein C8T65DRAFT_741155 [Cerioporus squamosus]|nr:hypothetical protein C8T65DRAFT_741155 [Cerioporus squamosus]
MSVLERGADDALLFPQFLNLKRIELELKPSGFPPRPQAWARCCEILHTLPAPALLGEIKMFALGMPLGHRTAYEGMDALDPLLEDGKFKQVKQVRLILTGSFLPAPPELSSMSLEEAMDVVRSKIPRLSSRPFVELRLETFETFTGPIPRM